ncbi:hypothetical protein JCM3770_003176 [Rhodotorula araucariae]
MTAVASTPALPPSLFPRMSPASPTATSLAPLPPASAAVDDDDLLALGAFTLDTSRDRELLCLSSFLKGVLPSAPGTAAHPPALNAGLTISTAATAGVGAGAWNGWRPQGGDGSAAPYGSPISFASSGPGSSVPSTSFAAAFSPPNNPPHAFAAYPSPAQAYAPLPGPGSPLSGASGSAMRGSWATAASVVAPGYRAPACSRERVPTLAAFRAAQADEDGGWKSRLRSSTRRAAQEQQQQQQQQQQAPAERDDDSMME